MSLETSGPIEHKNVNNGALSDKLHSNIYEVPDHLKKWFSHQGSKIFAEGREKWLSNDVVTWDELESHNTPYNDSFHQSMFDELKDYVYRERFKTQPANKVLDESNGVFYDVPENLKAWFDQTRLRLDSDPHSKLDGVITLDELSHVKQTTSLQDTYSNSYELMHSAYTQRFKHQGDVLVANELLNTTYKLPKDLQQWVNQNDYKLDGLTGKRDGEITASEILEFTPTAYDAPQDKQVHASLKEFVLGQPTGLYEIHKSFEEQVSKDPKSLKTWFEQHKQSIDTNGDGIICTNELYDYGTKTKLDAYDRTMVVGLHDYAKIFMRTPDASGVTSKDIDTTVKLALHETTPSQIALNSTIDAAKAGAAGGAIVGGAMGLYKSVALGSAVFSSWGSISAGSLATCAGLTVGGVLTGALVGTAAIGGATYGFYYFPVKDWYDKKTKAMQDAHLMK